MPTPVEIYSAKNITYFNAVRRDILLLLPHEPAARVLELGAGTGATLAQAKAEGRAGTTVGIDIVAVEGGPMPGVDRFLTGDVETMDLNAFEADPFDVIICADVLEHLLNPGAVVGRLARLLKPGGLLISSIPNFRHYTVLLRLAVEGTFRYEKAGFFDETHLRFFCRPDVVDLFEQQGLEIANIAENMSGYGLRQRIVNALTFGLLHEFFVFQFLTTARKPAHP